MQLNLSHLQVSEEGDQETEPADSGIKLTNRKLKASELQGHSEKANNQHEFVTFLSKHKNKKIKSLKSNRGQAQEIAHPW